MYWATSYVLGIYIGVHCIHLGQHYIYIGQHCIYVLGDIFLKIYVLDNNMYWVHAPNTYGGVAQYIYMYWVYILGTNVVR